MDKFWTYLFLILAMLIWSSSFILSNVALQSFTPVTLVTLRMLLATIVLLIFGLASHKLQPLRRKDIGLFLAAAFAQPFMYFICESYGLTLVSPTVASVVVSTIPVFAPLFAFLFLREKVTWFNVVGISMSFFGVFLLVAGNGNLSARPLGLFILLGAVFAAVMYSVLLRRIPAHYNNVAIVFYIHLLSLLFFIPTFLLVDLRSVGTLSIKWPSVVALVCLAVFSSVLAYILYGRAVRKIGVTKSNAFCNIQPGSTALLMWIFFGEKLSWVKIVAIIIVVAGLFVSQTEKQKRPK